jgi:hypothetical protein
VCALEFLTHLLVSLAESIIFHAHYPGHTDVEKSSLYFALKYVSTSIVSVTFYLDNAIIGNLLVPPTTSVGVILYPSPAQLTPGAHKITVQINFGMISLSSVILSNQPFKSANMVTFISTDPVIIKEASQYLSASSPSNFVPNPLANQTLSRVVNICNITLAAEIPKDIKYFCFNSPVGVGTSEYFSVTYEIDISMDDSFFLGIEYRTQSRDALVRVTLDSLGKQTLSTPLTHHHGNGFSDR